MDILDGKYGLHSCRRTRPWPVLLAINCLYIGFGAIVGTVQGGLPPVLREQGLDIGSLGWIYAFYLPFGLAFLWAHHIDRVRLPIFGHRTGWVLAMQLVAVASVLLVALGPGWPVALLVILGFAVTFAIATMDTALDALAVERIEEVFRPLASGLKLAALSIGAMIGNAAFVMAFSRHGWTITFLLLAGMLALLTIPLLFLDEQVGPKVEVKPSETPSLLRFIGDRGRRRRLILITLVSCVIFPLAGLSRIMLVDTGVPLDQIGNVVGTLGPISMLIVSAISLPLMARYKLPATFLAFGLLAASAVMLLAFANLVLSPTLAIVSSIVAGAAVSGVYVTLMAKILGWSAGSQPATDYAAYYGISRLASTVLTIAAAQAASRLDWVIFYGAGAAILIAVLIFANFRIFRSEQ